MKTIIQVSFTLLLACPVFTQAQLGVSLQTRLIRPGEEVNVVNLPAGTYLIRVSTEAGALIGLAKMTKA